MFTFTDKMYLCTVIMKVLALLLIEYRAPFSDIFNFKAWIFSAILIAQGLSRTTLCESSSVEVLSVDTVARDENCRTLLLNFQWRFQ